MGFMMVCALVENGLDAQTLLAFVVAVPLVLGMLALLCHLMRKHRFRVDGQGIRIDGLFGKKQFLRWADVRTAAIVHYDGSKTIVLSVEEPAEVLVKKRLMRIKQNSSAEIHLGTSDRMRGIVEHYLHMELPTILL